MYPHSRQQHCVRAYATAEATAPGPAERLQHTLQLQGVKLDGIELQDIAVEAQGSHLLALREFAPEQVILQVSGDHVATAADANQGELSSLTEGRGELISLALWLLQEQSKGSKSLWSPLIASLPLGKIDTPVLWSAAEQEELLAGSPCQAEARLRSQALDSEWQSIAAAIADRQSDFPPGTFNQAAFRSALAAVVASAVYLPSAGCFALVPLASTLPRTGQDSGAALDYDSATGGIAVRASQPIRPGERIALYDGRPNAEMLLSRGHIELDNPNNCLQIDAAILRADKMFMSKLEIAQAYGFSQKEQFGIYQDRMPVQLMGYLRLSRMQNAAELAAANLENDVMVSPMNEYEVLQLLLAECRDRLTAYGSSLEDEQSLLQSRGLSNRERVAAQLRLAEKRIIQGALDIVRRRLAPIRGVPTKEGSLTSPYSDLEEIFTSIEELPKRPVKFLSGLVSWAKGEQDPDWQKDKRKKQKQKQRRP